MFRNFFSRKSSTDVRNIFILYFRNLYKFVDLCVEEERGYFLWLHLFAVYSLEQRGKRYLCDNIKSKNMSLASRYICDVALSIFRIIILGVM